MVQFPGVNHINLYMREYFCLGSEMSEYDALTICLFNYGCQLVVQTHCLSVVAFFQHARG